ncbi:hypothetical protein EG329_005829 [Mollisiaceae sp. DMI_Dod_QoI]|nr:hypothetical protein EG329_005829 [Helotiales sp. DMI_Dod_QoI]
MPELDGGWPALELDGEADEWGPVPDLPPWESAESTSGLHDGYEWDPVYEMPSWQPPELAGDGYDMSDFHTSALEVDAHHLAGNTLTSLLSQDAGRMHPNHELATTDGGSITTQTDISKPPALKLDTKKLPIIWQHNDRKEIHTPIHHEDTGEHAHRNFLGSGYNTSFDTKFPSPPTSPIMRQDHDSPVSPIEDSLWSFPTSGSSRFSSLSSMMLEDTPMSSFSSSNASANHSSSSTTRVFEEKDMCFEPDDMEFLPTSSNDETPVVYRIEEPTYFEREPEPASILLRLQEDQRSRTNTFDFDFNNMKVPWDYTTIGKFLPSSAGRSLDQSTIEPVRNAASCDPHLYTTPTAHMSLLEQHPPPSPQSDNDHFPAQSPASDLLYRCTYGPCTFVPTGKKLYHKRTLQRHQQKCLYSPLPHKKKPCKCTFPGCNKGFSRSDGLNAHRKTSGHQVKIELQLKQEIKRPETR